MNYFIYYFLSISAFCFADLNRTGTGQYLHYIHELFDWGQEPMAISYQLQILSYNEFSDNSLIINETKTIHIEQNFINWDEKYFWRVRSIYDDNSYGNWIGSDFFFTAEPELGPFSTVVFDLQGREVWNDGDNDFLQNYINPYGQLYGFGDKEWPNHTETEYNFRNEILWHGPNDVYIDDHDFK